MPRKPYTESEIKANELVHGSKLANKMRQANQESTSDEELDAIDAKAATKALEEETATWGSTSEQVRDKGDAAEQRASRRFRDIRERKTFKPGSTRF